MAVVSVNQTINPAFYRTNQGTATKSHYYNLWKHQGRVIDPSFYQILAILLFFFASCMHDFFDMILLTTLFVYFCQNKSFSFV